MRRRNNNNFNDSLQYDIIIKFNGESFGDFMSECMLSNTMS